MLIWMPGRLWFDSTLLTAVENERPLQPRPSFWIEKWCVCQNNSHVKFMLPALPIISTKKVMQNHLHEHHIDLLQMASRRLSTCVSQYAEQVHGATTTSGEPKDPRSLFQVSWGALSWAMRGVVSQTIPLMKLTYFFHRSLAHLLSSNFHFFLTDRRPTTQLNAVE